MQVTSLTELRVEGEIEGQLEKLTCQTYCGSSQPVAIFQNNRIKTSRTPAVTNLNTLLYLTKSIGAVNINTALIIFIC
jgi:hypothetical protein